MVLRRFLIWAILLIVLGGAARGQTVSLVSIDPGLTSPNSLYRWLDMADQAYSAAYRNSYTYPQASVTVNFDPVAATFHGTLAASNLKPNFAYQVKLVGTPGTDSNERIGLVGRWWRQTWDGTAWSSGWNLNTKGYGTSPNPNDLLYFQTRDVADATSPTGKLYLYSGYLLMDYFLTDAHGNASITFQANSSFHVLWKTSQLLPMTGDGPVKTAAFDPATPDPAYDYDYPAKSVSIFGEWERLPIGGVPLRPGGYSCVLILTEECFHGSGTSYVGGWAAAMGANIAFTITPGPVTYPAGDANHDCTVNVLDLIFIRHHLGQSVLTGVNWQADVNNDGSINILDLILVRNNNAAVCQ